MRHTALLDRSRAALAVIDIQEGFRPVITKFEEIVYRTASMVQAAKLLEIPIIVTEQYPKGLGHTVREIAEHFPEATLPVEKTSFSACGVQEFDTRLRENHIEQVMICGIEAHICVSQTAHDLIQNGYQIHVLSDAIATRQPYNLELGINKMARAGAIISSIEMALFEVCKVGDPAFKEVQRLVKQLI
jgi:nicotinamidase-related amidase